MGVGGDALVSVFYAIEVIIVVVVTAFAVNISVARSGLGCCWLLTLLVHCCGCLWVLLMSCRCYYLLLQLMLLPQCC